MIMVKPEYKAGEQDLTYRMAANAIWNKLSIAMSLIGDDSQKQFLWDVLSEARLLADAIVHHHQSGDGPTQPDNAILWQDLIKNQSPSVDNVPNQKPEEAKTMQDDRMLKWFEYAHLPAKLQEISEPFGMLASQIVAKIEAGPERTVALRKLLEAKDAAVRAKLHPGG